MSIEDLIKILDSEINEVTNIEDIGEHLMNEIEFLKNKYIKKYDELRNKEYESDPENYENTINELKEIMNNIDAICDYFINIVIDKIKNKKNNDEINFFNFIENSIKNNKNNTNIEIFLNDMKDEQLKNEYNKIIINAKLIFEKTDFKCKKMKKYLEENSVKGCNKLLLEGIVISKDLNENKYDDFENLYNDYYDDFKKIPDLLNNFMKIYNEHNLSTYLKIMDCDISILTKTNKSIRSIYNSLEYLYCKYDEILNKNNAKSFLDNYSIPKHQYNTECPICLNVLTDEKCLTNCCHAYCLTCVRQYFNNDNVDCAVCKKEL